MLRCWHRGPALCADVGSMPGNHTSPVTCSGKGEPVAKHHVCDRKLASRRDHRWRGHSTGPRASQTELISPAECPARDLDTESTREDHQQWVARNSEPGLDLLGEPCRQACVIDFG